MVLSILALFAGACNKSDTPGPQSSCYPCPENDGQDQTRSRKPESFMKTAPESKGRYTVVNQGELNYILNTERRYVDTVKGRAPEREPVTKKPVNVLPQ